MREAAQDLLFDCQQAKDRGMAWSQRLPCNRKVRKESILHIFLRPNKSYKEDEQREAFISPFHNRVWISKLLVG